MKTYSSKPKNREAELEAELDSANADRARHVAVIRALRAELAEARAALAKAKVTP